MADEEKAQLDAARRLPLEERLEHKLWRARAEAADDIIAQCGRASGPDAPILGEAGARAARPPPRKPPCPPRRWSACSTPPFA